MRTIYIDNEYKCHAQNAEGLIPTDVDFFDGRSDKYIECFRFIPNGNTWTTPSGVVLKGACLLQFKDSSNAEKEELQGKIEDMLSQIEGALGL